MDEAEEAFGPDVKIHFAAHGVRETAKLIKRTQPKGKKQKHLMKTLLSSG